MKYIKLTYSRRENIPQMWEMNEEDQEICDDYIHEICVSLDGEEERIRLIMEL